MIAFACLFVRIFVRDKLQLTLLNVNNNNTSLSPACQQCLALLALETTGPVASERDGNNPAERSRGPNLPMVL